MKRRRPLNPADLDRGLLDELSSLLTGLEENNSNTEPLKHFLETGRGDQLLQYWSTCGEASDHAQLSASTSAVSRLIQHCGEHAVLVELGTRVVKNILDNHMKIIYRCMYIGRPALTNPSLLLLTNITKFHRGLLTNDLFSTFDFSMAVIPKLLSLKEDVKVDEAKRKGMRAHFVKFFLSFITNSSVIVRRDLIAQKKVISGWFKFLSYDDADTILLMIDTLENKVLKEPSYLKSTKINLFNDWSVALLARLLGRSDSPTAKPDVSIGTLMFNFLIFLTSDMTYGIRFPDKQWYLPDADSDDSKESENKVNNRVLLSLVKSLKPWEHIHRQDLVLNILSNCPELVAFYLKDDFSISLDPKLSVFWISNILFFSRLIQIPIPSDLLNSTSFQPPKVEIMVEHILPQPLSKSALSKSLLHTTPLVKFNACQVLIFAFNKLEAVISIYRTKSWIDSYYLLLEEMLNRIPDIQTIVSSVNSIENFDTYALLKTVLIKTIALYAKILPEIFIKSKFTLPTRLATSLEKTDMNGLELVDLRNVLEIQARLGGIGKWWNKTPDLPYSLFTTLLRLSALLNDKLFTDQITSLVEYLSKPTMLFRQSSIISPASILIHSLRTSIPFMSTNEQAKVWKLFDESVSRCLRSPYKYVDKLASFQKKIGSSDVSVSPFLAIIIEQWKFVDKSTPCEQVEKWLQKYIRDSIVSGENLGIIKELAGEAELSIYSDLVQIESTTGFETIQDKWSNLCDESILSELYCERMIAYPASQLIQNSDTSEKVSSATDLFFARFRLLHDKNPSVCDYLFSQLSVIPSLMYPLIVLKEFWSDLLSAKHHTLSCGFLELLRNLFLESDLRKEPNFFDIVARLKEVISFEELSQEETAMLLQKGSWILDKQYLESQIEYFVLQKTIYDLDAVFDQYLKLSAQESVSESLLTSIINYAMKSSNPSLILISLKTYIDNAPSSFTINSSFVEALKDYCGKEAFSKSQLLSSLIRRIPVLDSSFIEGFVSKSWVDDFTFLTIVREFLVEFTDKKDEEKNILQPLISSASSIIVKILSNGSSDASADLVKAAISVSDGLLDFHEAEDMEKLRHAVVEFISQSKGSETILPETVSLVGKLFSLNGEEKTDAASATRIWSQRCILWLNKRLAEDEHIGDKAQQFIDSLTVMINKHNLNLWLVVPTDSLNTLLEIVSNKYLHILSILKLIGSLVLPTRLPGKQIEFTKLLQIILNHEKVFSLMEMDRSSATSEGSGQILAYIIYTLFNVDVTRHSNRGIQDRVLCLCMGTQRPQDMLLIDILKKIESRNSTSFANSVYSWVFSATTADMFEQQQPFNRTKKSTGIGENYDDTLLSDAPTTKLSPLFNQTRDGFEATIDSYLIKNTIRNFDCTVPFFPYMSALLPPSTKKGFTPLSFDEKIQLLNDYTRLLRSEYTYDPEFLLLLLASSNLVKDSKIVDLKTLVETGGLGIIICCLSYPPSITSGLDGNSNQKHTVENSVAKISQAFLEAGLASIADSTYREEDVLRIFLSKILFFLRDVEEEDDKEENVTESVKQLPCSVAVFLAQILEIASNPGHFLYLRAFIQYILAGHSIRPNELPLYSQLTTASKTDDGPSDISGGSGDMQGKELVWLADTLISGLVTFNDVNLYLKAGVFEWLFNITSAIPLITQPQQNNLGENHGGSNAYTKVQNSFYVANHQALREKTKALIQRAQEISGGSTALLTRSGLLAWIQCEQHNSSGSGLNNVSNTSEHEQIAKLGLRSVLTINPVKLKEWTNTSDVRNTAMGFDPSIEL